MLKKVMSLVLACSLLFTAAPASASAETGAVGEPQGYAEGNRAESTLGSVEIEVRDKSGKVLAKKAKESDDFLEYHGKYNFGSDVIVFKAPKGVKHMVIQADEYLGIPTVSGQEVSGAKNETEARKDLSYTYGESIVYAPEGEIEFTVPKPADYSDKNNFSPYDPRAFMGDVHKITARVATEEEIYSYRNLAVNPFDNFDTGTNYSSSPIHYNQHYDKYSYPHAIANVVTRDELRFVPRNAIDGFELNNWHSFFPYQSWAGGARSDLDYAVLFGRTVEIDRVDLILRAQWSDGHDACWNKAILEFSDGTEQVIELEKTNQVQTFQLNEKKKVSWVRLKEFEQFGEKLGFAALTELRVYGQESREADTLPSGNEIINLAKKVDDYWINLNGADLKSYVWNNAVYHTGNMELYYMTGDENYRKYSEAWSDRWDWMGNTNYDTPSHAYGSGFHADNHTQYQTYLDLYSLAPEEKKIRIAKHVIDKQMASGDKSQWYWVDALYMGMPVYAKLGQLTGDDKYFDWMYELFHYTEKEIDNVGLFHEEDGLWYRDSKYIYPNGSHSQSANGKKVYWSRGEGWAIAAMAKVLEVLPDSDQHRAEYERVFKKMAESLLKRQGEDGFWRRNLGDYDELSQPETSGTAFFAYAFAWGINHGLLDKEIYMPAVIKTFHAMNAIAIQPTGRVGRVQPIGENPSPSQDIGYARTQDFGVGAVLLMLTEMSKLGNGIVGTDLQPMLEKRMIQAVGIKVGSKNILQGAAYQGQACHTEQMEYAPVKENGKVYVPKSFVSEKLGIVPEQDLITKDGVEYAKLESVAQTLGKELFVYEDIVVIGRQKNLFQPSQEQNLLSLLGQVLDDGAFPGRPAQEDRFEYMLPAASMNLVPITAVTASATPQAENAPANVLDRAIDTRWSAESTTDAGQWLRVDFNKTEINKVGAAFHSGSTRSTSYKIEVLDAQGNWLTVREKGGSSGNSNGYEYTEFDPVEATAVRITGYGNSENKWTSIVDLEVLATKTYPEGTWYPYFSRDNWLAKDLGSGHKGEQVIEFDILPLADKQDGAIYYTGQEAVLNDWGDAPIAMRLNTEGYFDARDGGAYKAQNKISYQANQTYHVKIVVDLDAKKYSIYVSGQDEKEWALAVDYAFRTGAKDIQDIGKFCARGGDKAPAGKFVVLNHKLIESEKPVEKCTVTLNANGGKVTPQSLVVDKGETAVLPEPERKGYKFKGWSIKEEGGSLITEQTRITEDCTFYAQWEEESREEESREEENREEVSYTVTLNANGGSVYPKSIKAKEGSKINLPTPTRKNYSFKGWYTAVTGGTKIPGSITVTKDLTVHAQWEEKASKPLKKGEKFTVGGFKYQVLAPASGKKAGKVALLGYAGKGKSKKLSIRDSVKAPSGRETYRVTEIGTAAFKGSKSLTSVSIGKYVTVIGKRAFADCKKLGTVKGAAGVKRIRAGAFSRCIAMKKVTVGKHVTRIDEKAFFGCSRLANITVQATRLKKVGNKAIAGIKKNASIKVPGGKKAAYKKLFGSKTGYLKTMKIK